MWVKNRGKSGKFYLTFKNTSLLFKSSLKWGLTYQFQHRAPTFCILYFTCHIILLCLFIFYFILYTLRQTLPQCFSHTRLINFHSFETYILQTTYCGSHNREFLILTTRCFCDSKTLMPHPHHNGSHLGFFSHGPLDLEILNFVKSYRVHVKSYRVHVKIMWSWNCTFQNWYVKTLEVHTVSVFSTLEIWCPKP